MHVQETHYTTDMTDAECDTIRVNEDEDWNFRELELAAKTQIDLGFHHLRRHTAHPHH